MIENKHAVAAVILCAGKGTRMNDGSKNKVSFPCAGKPVIGRIIENMRQAGVKSFVLVVGYQAQSVMESLAGVPGIVYAFQAEQKGTGHAVQCGLQALESMGFAGKAIVSMGDKIIASNVIRDMVKRSEEADVLWGVQPLSANPNGGRIIELNGSPCGVVELADIAYHSLANLPKEQWDCQLQSLGLNVKKANKVKALAECKPPIGRVSLNGRDFSVSELCKSRYANAGLYCFGIRESLEALANCNSDNAQGEIYMTDALEYFARHNKTELFLVSRKEDMLTFSTKSELRDISRYFLRPASAILDEISRGLWNGHFTKCYGNDISGQAERYMELLQAFIAKFGDRKAVITRAPGRVNLMGRHIDHRGGCTNLMAIGSDTLMVVSPRDEDDVVRVSNMSAEYPEKVFSISECLALGNDATEWLSYLETDAVKSALSAERGHWVNYIKAAALRFQMAMDFQLSGMDVMVTGNIPAGAGLSSSSALVVAMGEALVALNCINITDRQFVDLCSEGEWFVGSRGGAGDHAAMKMGRTLHVVQLRFKPFDIGQSYPWPKEYGVVVADSCEQAKKSEGSRDTYNGRVATYEFGFMLLHKRFAQYGWKEFRDLADVQPQREIYHMLQTLPERVTRKDMLDLLPEQHEKLYKLFETHAEPKDSYDLRGVMLYGISECIRARLFGTLLEKKDYDGIGEMMKLSHDGDRLVKHSFPDDVLEKLYCTDADVSRQCGAYACSTEKIDHLCDLLNSTDGVLGCSIVGAGLGGSVIAFVRKDSANEILAKLDREYYKPLGLKMSADCYVPSAGSLASF